MQNATTALAPSPPHFFFAPNSHSSLANARLTAQNLSADREFVGMLNSYRNSGGLARLQELTSLGSIGTKIDISRLATSISQRELICFEWQAHAWLPLFQFNVLDMTPHPQMQSVIPELSCIYDPWELALWFSQPNPWLGDRAPADTLLTDVDAVRQAARADRFVSS